MSLFNQLAERSAKYSGEREYETDEVRVDAIVPQPGATVHLDENNVVVPSAVPGGSTITKSLVILRLKDSQGNFTRKVQQFLADNAIANPHVSYGNTVAYATLRTFKTTKDSANMKAGETGTEISRLVIDPSTTQKITDILRISDGKAIFAI